MKKTFNFIARTFAAILLVSLVATSCKKDNGNDGVQGKAPILVTSDIFFSQMNSAGVISGLAGGTIASEGDAPVTARGVCWSTHELPTIADNKSSDGSGTGKFTSNVIPLKYAIYYFRAYATNKYGTAYGNSLRYSTLYNGQTYQGGYVGYVIQPGEPGYKEGEAHGLIIEPGHNNFIEVTNWTAGGRLLTGATGTAYGTGRANTNAIVATYGPGTYAARYCFDLVLNGYDDWFLPSKDELNKIYSADKYYMWGVGYEYYWTSSEVSIDETWIQRFTNGNQSTYDKKGKFYARAVRTF